MKKSLSAAAATNAARISRTGNSPSSQHAAYVGLVSAVRSVEPRERTKAFILLGAAAASLFVLFASRLLWLLEPLYAEVYYGTVSKLIYYGAVGVLFTVFTIALYLFLRKFCDTRLFESRKIKIGVPRTIAVIALCAATMFFMGIGFKFTVKIQVEMGSGVTMATALTNIAVYLYYGLHLWLGLTAAVLTQKALRILIPTKHEIAYGAIFLVTVFGLFEFVAEAFTTTHMYPWLYYILTYVYAAVYVLTGESYHLTFWTSVIIMVL